MASLDSIMKRYRRMQLSVMRGSLEELSHRNIDRTPVLSGSMVLSMTASIGGITVNPVTLPVPDSASAPYGKWINPRAEQYKDKSKANASSVALKVGAGSTYNLAVHSPQALLIEYEGWSYKKAPSGMRNRSIAEWQSIANSEVRRVRNGS